MPKVFTLNNGVAIPWLGFGTGTALYGRDAANFVRLAIDNNITHLDGAQMYNNEDTLGAGIKASGKSRSDLFVTTKLNKLAPGETVKDSLKGSLAKLGLDYVDLFLIHDPTKATKEGKLAEWWKGMEEVQGEGLAKAIGVSNFKVEDLKIVLETGEIVPAVNQIELHPYVWKAAKPIVEFCQEKGIAIESYGGQTPIVRAKGGPLDPTLSAISERLGKAHGKPVSTGQVLTKWLLQRDVIVVTTTSKVERIKEFLDTENVPDLNAKEIKAIDEEGAKLHKRVYMAHVFGE
ncbi:hypothetical protein GALMADRAFT_72096 [Galerina marginata CBS 339.88]|uniref:NADP-dependent oxidoreductase domain-containing protein n=1 Tax=Galerina marginata (strain CBS 339.88) TaxID=685588 RepID=A0A067T3B9_GALM3|nr:hypothetical protein GALMADRAFT_72096 [Galerina marginata CBS 339.88]